MRDSRQYSLDELVKQNVEAIQSIEQAKAAQRSRVDVVVDRIAAFCGNLGFVYVHFFVFGFWLTINTAHGIPKAWRFDPPPYGMLTLIVSLEAIFLSAFILISQNRQQKIADQRNHLDLQINLLAEQETSRMISMLDQIMQHFGITHEPGDARILSQETDPRAVVAQLDQVEESG